MKKLWMFMLIASLLSSCGPSHPLNYAKIEFRDSKWASYYLHSMHDSDLVVTPAIHSNNSTEIIPFRNIERIFLQGSTTAGEWLGFFGGVAIGMGVYELVATPYEKSHDGGEGGVIAVPFLPIGVLIGNAITDKLFEVDFNSPQGRKLLRKRSEYILVEIK